MRLHDQTTEEHMIYTWQCRKCGNTVEVERKKDEIDVPPVICDTCCADPDAHCRGDFVRIMSKNSFALKGGGWAKQGYQKGRKS
jgi:predicted nucleic acid-binding Zn ribbon protein